jgi:hypothetical protein
MYSVVASHESAGDAFIVLHLGKPFEHYFIELPPTYEEYLRQLGSRSRQSVQYSERKLARDMENQVRLERFDRENSVPRFVADAMAISRKTYQWNLLGLGLRDADALAKELVLAARQGWLRSYILYCRNIPVAFMLGYHYRKAAYQYMDVGYDQDYAAWSVGTVLQLKVLQDLYGSPDQPRVFDFSTGEGPHKARFGNVSRREANVLLLPRTFRNRCIASAFTSTERLSVAAVQVLDQLGLKARLKKLIRRSTRA